MHQLEFKNRNFIFTCKKHNLLCCLLNILVTLFLTIFQRFPNTFGKFLKIPIEEDFRRLTKSVSTHFPKNYKDYQSSEDNWRLPKISNQDPMMFWSYINTFKCNFKALCNYKTIAMVIFSHVKVTCYFMCEDIIFLCKGSLGNSVAMFIYENDLCNNNYNYNIYILLGCIS